MRVIKNYDFKCECHLIFLDPLSPSKLHLTFLDPLSPSKQRVHVFIFLLEFFLDKSPKTKRKFCPKNVDMFKVLSDMLRIQVLRIQQVLSCVKLVVSDLHVSLKSEDIHIPVILRMNHEFMEYMRVSYPDTPLSEFKSVDTYVHAHGGVETLEDDEDGDCWCRDVGRWLRCSGVRPNRKGRSKGRPSGYRLMYRCYERQRVKVRGDGSLSYSRWIYQIHLNKSI